MFKLTPLACSMLFAGASFSVLAGEPAVNPDVPAQSSDANPPANQPARVKPEVSTPQKVVITSGRTDLEERRQSTAGKLVFGREELDREGDTSIGEVIKRLPGVTVGGRAGRGGDIRMRGMGNGYTQILLNGERIPRGFSLDTLTPDMVERIEVIRGTVAEYSTQAIAGTINIVLREDYKQKNTELRVSDGFEQGRSAPNIAIAHPGEIGALSYTLAGSVFQNHQHDDVITDTINKDPNGNVNLDQHLEDLTNRLTRGVHLTPRFNYKFENGDVLTVQPFVMHSESNFGGGSTLDQPVGTPQPYATAFTSGNSENTMARLFGTWQHKFDDNAKLNVKFGGGLSHSDSTSLRDQYDGTGLLSDAIYTNNDIRDQGWNTGGKYSKPFGDSNTFAMGWSAEQSQRNETSISLDNGNPQFNDSGDNLSASTRTLAVFVQDEWDINKQWSVYAGLRWEGIKTTSTLPTGPIVNQSSVWSPIFHAVWRIPEHNKDQVRLALTSSYRAPSLNDLIAVPSISPLNGPTRPDSIGNPNLKPELARGIDLAYEHYLTQNGILSANFFMRDISDLMRREVALVDTRWVSSPQNFGNATTHGLELEAKFQLREFFPNAPAIDFRTNYSRFWSSVDGIPGPDNRLDQQPKQTGNLGFDYHVDKLPLTVGGNYNWTPAYVIQSTLAQLNTTGAKRQLDVYGLWKFSANTQLRLAMNNLLPYDALSGSTVNAGGLDTTTNTTAKTYTTYTLKLELKI
jgi:outer membrane receptor for ferrienterochelin and colicins